MFASIQSPAKRVVLVASHSNKGTKSSSLLSNLLLALFDTITSNDLFQFVNTESPSMPFQLEQVNIMTHCQTNFIISAINFKLMYGLVEVLSRIVPQGASINGLVVKVLACVCAFKNSES